MTLVVVEGVDGSGKSTLIANLAHILPDSVHIIRRGPIQRHPMEEYEYPLANYTPGYDMHFLLDRWHIGELIYGPLYRGASQLTPAMRMHVDMVLDRLGAVKILMDTPLPEVQRRLAKRGEDFLQPQHVALVHDAYREHCTPELGWTYVSPATRADDILNLAVDAEQNAYYGDKFDTYVGGWKPQLLLLGDKRNDPVHGRPRYPWAFVPYRDTSGHFLLTGLHSVGFTNFGIANANEETDVYDLWDTLGRPPICVLGREAENGLHRRGLMDDVMSDFKDAVKRVVQHPQYVKRFKIRTMREYAELIASTVDG